MGVIVVACMLLATVAIEHALAVDPVVANVVACQLPGSHYDEITYDLTCANSDSLHVTMEISADGGATFAVPAQNFFAYVG